MRNYGDAGVADALETFGLEKLSMTPKYIYDRARQRVADTQLRGEYGASGRGYAYTDEINKRNSQGLKDIVEARTNTNPLLRLSKKPETLTRAKQNRTALALGLNMHTGKMPPEFDPHKVLSKHFTPQVIAKGMGIDPTIPLPQGIY